MWHCRLLAPAEWGAHSSSWWDTGRLQVGDMTHAEWLADLGLLSPEYRRDWQHKRLPLVVVLPGPMVFCLDFRAHDKQGRLLANGWTVTGEAPRITVHPSIDTSTRRPGGWHGWIRDGVIT